MLSTLWNSVIKGLGTGFGRVIGCAIGCGALIVGTIVILVIGSVICSVGNSEDQPNESDEMPTPPPLVNALTIWGDYETNETRANIQWKEIWLRVQLDTISEIESGGKVQKYMNSSGSSHIELDFKEDADVLPLNPGQSITAICKLSGFELDSRLNFKDCRFP